jgi:hypothetical protein
VASYPLVEKFLAGDPFGPNHAAHNFKLSNPIVPALEYFLSIDAVRGHGKKLAEIRSKPVGTPCKNDRLIQWASLCAEIGAICLLGKALRLKIVALEQVSPRSARPNANCDIVAVVDGKNNYFEVKRNGAEDKQCLPEVLEDALSQLEGELSFDITPELVDRDYDCSALDEKLSRLKDHVAAFQRRKEEGLTGEAKPSTFEDEAFTVMFHPKTRNNVGAHFFSPVFPKQLSPYLLGPGKSGRDGKPMTPMVQKAAEKGADYLVCRVPKWGDWTKVVGEIFEDFSYNKRVTYYSKDPRLDLLEGMVLFARYDDFCIVNNLRARTRNWLAA